MVIIIQAQKQRQLTELQKCIIEIYYNDGHSYQFLQEFFHFLFPHDTDLVDEYLDKLFLPKMLTFIKEDSSEDE